MYTIVYIYIYVYIHMYIIVYIDMIDMSKYIGIHIYI